MALTSRDETDLLIPLYQGMHAIPRFATFLERLKRRTDSDYVSLIVRIGDAASGAISEYFAGADMRRRARESGTQDPFDLDRIHYDSLRPGRVYSITELIEHDPVARTDRARKMSRLGVGDERVVRIAPAEGISAWLLIARSGKCTAADSALLSTLAPYVAVAVETVVGIDRERMRGRISAIGLARSNKGWMLFDRDARLVAIDPQMDARWQELGGAHLRIGERLRGLDLHAERDLAVAAAAMAADPRAPSRPLVLRTEPHMEALLLPVAPDSHGTEAETPNGPVLLALCPLPGHRSHDAAARLAQVHDLPRREAELAMALADGLSIAEAAEEMGLTLETARNYSKRLYAKLGVRGQAELVRLVYESCAVLA